MKSIIIFLFLLAATRIDASTFEEVKKEISQLQQKLIEHPNDADLHYRLALSYCADQEMDQAFLHFLNALELCDVGERPVLQESQIYKKALSEYLDQSGSDPIGCAQVLLAKYEQFANDSPNDLLLNLLIATAYANTGKFELFFEKLYRVASVLSDHFLMHKTCGILFSRLAAHRHLPQEKKYFRDKAAQQIELAQEREPKDASLYKILILCAKEDDNAGQIRSLLTKMVENKVKFARADIFFYVYEADRVGEFESAKKIIDLAKEYYHYSKGLNAAEEYLTQRMVGDARARTR